MRIKVVYFQRRRSPFAHSLEGYFDQIREVLDEIDARVCRAKHYSTSVRGFCSNLVSSRGARGDVNHIAGDIHYVSYLLPRRQTILTILDCGFERNPSPLKRQVLRWLWFVIPVRRVAVVTTISSFSKAAVVRNAKCDPARVQVIPICVSSAYKPVPKPFDAARPTILHMGTGWNKNLERVVEALRDIPCHLHVIGNLSPAQRSLLEGMDFTNSVNLPEEALVQAYVDADIVSFVSTYEGFGMPIVEANAVGRPVIAGNVTAMPETAGDAACLVDPFSVEAIREGFLRLIRDETYRETLVENGFQNRKRFDPRRIADAYMRIYAALAGAADTRRVLAAETA